MLNVSIYRYNPEVDAEPYMQDFEVDTQGKDYYGSRCVWKSLKLMTQRWFFVAHAARACAVQTV